jgi:hypothetical protein
MMKSAEDRRGDQLGGYGDREHVTTSPAILLKSASPPRVLKVKCPNALEATAKIPS